MKLGLIKCFQIMAIWTGKLCMIIKLLLFKLIQFFLSAIIVFSHPFLLLFSLFLPPLRKRLIFELQAKKVNINRPFHFIFEISSQGELEQVWPLIEYHANHKKDILILYASTSVDRDVQKRCQAYPSVVVAPLPIISYFFINSPFSQSFHQLRAENFVFCRYDFYPHLLRLSLACQKRFLVSASLKGKELSYQHKKAPIHFFAMSLKRFHWRWLLMIFDVIYCASSEERQRIAQFLAQAPQKRRPQLEVYEFRKIQILKRLIARDQTLETVPGAACLVNFLKASKRPLFVLGSAWPVDIEMLALQELSPDLRQEFLSRFNILIAPHGLSKEFIASIDQALEKRLPDFQRCYWDGAAAQFHNSQQVIHIVTLPGILCELYSYADYAYVGGGFGRSIHSVLEPFIAGANCLCGERTFRSTEYDYVTSLDAERIIRLVSKNHFADYVKNLLSAPVKEKRDHQQSLRDFKSAYHDEKERLANIVKKFELAGSAVRGESDAE